jgi:uncharacterized protein (TIGR02145 family)
LSVIKKQIIMKKLHFIFALLFACTLFFAGCKKDGSDSDGDNGTPSTETFLVTFKPNGGEGTMEPQTFVDNVSKELEKNAFTHTDSVFIGWNKKADDSGDYYMNRQRIVVSSDMDLHAQWANPEGNGQPCATTPTVQDLDGNTYNTVQIGSQCWMRENLKTTQYKTGADILVISNSDQWVNNYTGAMCYYDNDASNAEIFGALYNGFAVRTGNLCPEGWHIPSDAEWNALAQFLGGAGVAGYQMKALYHWLENNANNESSFTAYPAGSRLGHPDASFFDMGRVAYFWSSTEYALGNISKILTWSSRELANDYQARSIGLSVRCIKD